MKRDLQIEINITFNNLWRLYSQHYLWKQRVEIERKYGKNPNSTIPCKLIDSILQEGYRIS